MEAVNKKINLSAASNLLFGWKMTESNPALALELITHIIDKAGEGELFEIGCGQEAANVVRCLPYGEFQEDELNEVLTSFGEMMIEFLAENEFDNINIGAACELISIVA